MLRTLRCVAAAIALGGCVAPTEGPNLGDAGPQPSMEQARAAILDHFNRTLRDPESVRQFQIVSGPTLVTWYRGAFLGGGHESAWLYCFEYNAKNAYGGYVGLRTDGVAMRVYGTGLPIVLDNVNWAVASRRC